MGADDFHVSVETGVGKTACLVERTRTQAEKMVLAKFEQIELVAHRWERGEITAQRGMETIFGVINSAPSDGSR